MDTASPKTEREREVSPTYPAKLKAMFPDAVFVSSGKLWHAEVTITPEMAAQHLEEYNIHNRNVRTNIVAIYARAMILSTWALTGQPIIYDWDGILRDGQHRLKSCVATKRSFVVTVTWGIDPDDRKYLDQVAPRNGADVLAMEATETGTPILAAPSRLSATAAEVFRWENDMGRHGKVVGSEIEDIYRRHPDLGIYVNDARRIPFRYFQKSRFAAVLYLGAWANRGLADLFVNQVIEGTGLTKGDPAHTLRATAMVNSSGTRHLEPPLMQAYITKAWNATYFAKPLSVLKMGANEAYPEIAGVERKDPGSVWGPLP
jgi:hypothetical protein